MVKEIEGIGLEVKSREDGEWYEGEKGQDNT